MAKLNELELQSKTINWLRFPFAVLVIFIHLNYNYAYTPNSDNPFLNPNSYYKLIRTIAGISVPCFYMFSGYLFFNKLKEWNKTVYFTKIKTRLRTLVLPYILFSIVSIVLHILLKILKADGSAYPFLNDLFKNWYNIFWNYRTWTFDVDNINMFGDPLPLYAPYVLSLWFLRDLIVMVFISPIVYYLLKCTKIWGLVVLFFFFYTKIWVEIPGFSTRFFLTAFFFFSLGAYFGINRKNIVISLRKYQLAWFILALITFGVGTYYYDYGFRKFFHPVFILSGVISVVNITSYFMEREKLRVRETLSKASFFIYCTHAILILGFTERVFRVSFKVMMGADNTTIFVFATYLLAPVACAGIILCIYLLMKRFTPKLLSLFTGNRG